MRKTLAGLLAVGALMLTACGTYEANTATGRISKEDQAIEACTSHFAELDNFTDYTGWSDSPQVKIDRKKDEVEVRGVARFTTKRDGPGLFDVECDVKFSDGGAFVYRGGTDRQEQDSERPSSSKTSQGTSTISSGSAWGDLNGTLLEQMKERGIPTGDITNAIAVDTGLAACEAMDSGVEPRELLDLMMEMPVWDMGDSLLYLELSFSNLCPEHATI